MNGNKNVKNIGYYAGLAFGIVISLCLMAIIVALTAKIIFWIM